MGGAGVFFCWWRVGGSCRDRRGCASAGGGRTSRTSRALDCRGRHDRLSPPAGLGPGTAGTFSQHAAGLQGPEPDVDRRLDAGRVLERQRRRDVCGSRRGTERRQRRGVCGPGRRRRRVRRYRPCSVDLHRCAARGHGDSGVVEKRHPAAPALWCVRRRLGRLVTRAPRPSRPRAQSPRHRRRARRNGVGGAHRDQRGTNVARREKRSGRHSRPRRRRSLGAGATPAAALRRPLCGCQAAGCALHDRRFGIDTHRLGRGR